MELLFPLKSAFLAIPLESEAKAAFQKIQSRLKEFDEVFRFQNPQSPHLTLQFWKERMEIEYYQIVPQAKKIADSTEPFHLKVQGVSTFGTNREDRVLHLVIPFNEDLARLKKRCPWPSLQEFTPHITLAHMKHPQRFAVQKKKIMKLLDDIEFEISVDRIRLYAEIDGKKQAPIQDFALSGR